MQQDVVTELVIDSDTSGADNFTRAMDGAEAAAGRGVAAADNFSAGLVALGVGSIGAVAAIKSMLDYVIEANKSLADLQTVAKQTGLSLAELQGVKFAGGIAGLSDSQVTSGLEKSAALLNDASRNANSLSKELEANGISIKNANGQLISENQLLTIAGELVRRANNPGDAIAIAQMLGFTKEWIPLLEQGGAAMSRLAAEAQAAGAVIDDETIEKATEFDAQWRKSSVEFSSYMKAALSELLPYVDQLIEGAAQFIKSLDKNKIQQLADDQLKTLNTPLGIPEEGVLHVDGAQLNDGLKTFVESPVFLPSTWAALGRAFASSIGFMTPGQAAGAIPGYAGSQITEPSYPSAAALDAAFDKANPANPGSRKNPLPGLSASDYATGGGSIVASKDTGGGDAVDRAINTLNKHTLQQEADTKAVGLGAAALAGFRAEAAETAAVQANGGKETDKQAAAFAVLKDRAMAAAEALARAKVANEISFGGKTAFLSQDDVAIATKLKDIYPDVTAALNSTEAAQLRFNTTARQLSSTIENNLVTGLTDIATGAKGVEQGFKDLAVTVLKSIEQMIIKIAIVQPMMAALQASVTGSGILGFLGIGSAAAGSSATALAEGIIPLHTGGIVGSETGGLPRSVDASLFSRAPRFHTGGIAGDEVPIIAKKGEGVFTPGQMAALGNAGAQTNFTYAPNIDARGADAQVVARLAQVVSDDRKQFERNVQAVVARTRSNNPGAFR